MSARHDSLYIATEGRLHRLAPEFKVAATVGFILAVVATPREAVWAFAVDLLIVLAVAAIGGVPIGHIV
ncbi:MAG: cobalt ECF transporter T component CbiQ, partial [Ilumatobacteraceae bacterium]